MDTPVETPRRLVALVGPTASGKTSLAVEVCARLDFPVEAIAVDSRQGYRGLDVATGKPTADEAAQLRHHLVDTITPRETYDAGSFRQDVATLLPALWDRGVTPLLVGGAGFYLKALTEGFIDVPSDDAALAELRVEHAAQTLDELRQDLEAKDPESAKRIHPNDRYRTERALELLRLTGRTATEIYGQHRPQPVCGVAFDFVVIDPPREELHRRIALRTRAWLDGGWRQEVRGLLEEGYVATDPGLCILGYRDVVALERGQCTADEAYESIVVQTRQYARNQRTWFRKLEGRCESLNAAALRLESALRNAQAISS